MYFYYLVILVSVLLYVVVYSSKLKNKRSVYLFLTFLFLIIVSGLRGYDVGGDLNHYLANYPELGKQSLGTLFANRSKYGYIFALLCKLAYSINHSNTSFLFISSIVSLVPVGLFLKKFSPQPVLSVFIYITFAFYTDTFNNVRASMALGVCLLSMPFILERKFWKFFFIYLIALEIHQTVFPFIALYFLFEKRLTMKLILICIGGCFVVSQMIAGLMAIINMLAVAYDSGAYSAEGMLGESYSGGYKLLLMMVAMCLGFFWINRHKLGQYYRKDSLLVYLKSVDGNPERYRMVRSAGSKIQLCMICSVIACCILCFATVSTELTRLSYFYSIAITVLIPLTLRGLKAPQIRKLAIFGVVMFFLAYFNSFVMTARPEMDNSNSQHTLPYYTFWQKSI